MSPTPKQMGARIRRLRKAKGMSQQELADKARLTRVYITRVEAGQQDPSLSTINAIARALDVSAAELMK
jgi:transcriptional regulator with XRE-family HTH domain